MSQITLCPHCQTAFRVVADQLRVSDGWVRCGQCQQVFDAAEQLQGGEAQPPLLTDLTFDPVLESAPVVTTAHVWSSARSAVGLVQDAAPADQEQGFPEVDAARDAWDVPQPVVPAFLRSASPTAQERRGEPPLPVLPDLQAGDELQAPQVPPPLPAIDEDLVALGPGPAAATADEDAPAPPDMAPQEEDAARWAQDGAIPAAEEGQGASQEECEPSAISPWNTVDAAEQNEAEEDGGFDTEPGFVKAARRGAFWRRPLVRGTLVLAGLLLCLTLGLQWLHQERDQIAARYPQARPWLAQWCAWWQCRLQPPRAIDAVVIDSSSFVKLRSDAQRYQLQWALRNNHQGAAVAMPALELTLTDALDQPLMRRVLLPADVGAPAELAAAGVWSGALTLRVDGAAPVAGYRLLAFYP